MEFAACHHSDVENFELGQKFLKNLHIPQCDDIDLERVWTEVSVA
jgi:hypothetical protein